MFWFFARQQPAPPANIEDSVFAWLKMEKLEDCENKNKVAFNQEYIPNVIFVALSHEGRFRTYHFFLTYDEVKTALTGKNNWIFLGTIKPAHLCDCLKPEKFMALSWEIKAN